MQTRAVHEVLGGRTFIAASSQTSASEAARLMKDHHISAILIVDGEGRLVGICAERDIVVHVVAENRDPALTRIDAIMTAHPQTIALDRPFGHALHMMYEGSFHHLPVIDGEGRPAGILSARDALSCEAVDFEHELVQREEITVML